MSTTVGPRAADQTAPAVRSRRWRVLTSHRMAAPVAVGCCLASGAAYVAATDPAAASGRFLPCPFRTLTGMWCPGCGLTRATHHLLRGDVVQAVRFHLFVIPIIIAIAASWFVWSMRRWRGVDLDTARVSPPSWIVGTAVVVLVAFAVTRNLPAFDVLRG